MFFYKKLSLCWCQLKLSISSLTWLRRTATLCAGIILNPIESYQIKYHQSPLLAMARSKLVGEGWEIKAQIVMFKTYHGHEMQEPWPGFCRHLETVSCSPHGYSWKKIQN